VASRGGSGQASPVDNDQVVELRQYTLHPGARDTLVALFEAEFVTGQEAAGIHVIGTFRDLDDPDRFVWLRGFSTMDDRKTALERFYYGPVWQAHRAAANATMIDSDDVLLLRPVDGFRPLGEPGFVAVTVCAGDVAPTGPTIARLRTEPAANTFPALPVRTGEDVTVWLSRAHEPLPPAAEARVIQRLRLAPTARSPLR
jgi:hypothetical protein